MDGNKKFQRLYIILLIVIALFAVNFVSLLSFLNYRSMVIEMEEQLISRAEQETISSMEIALNFGKDFYNFYGIQEVFKNFESRFKAPYPFIITSDNNNIIYESENNKSANSGQLKRFIADNSVRRAINSIHSGEYFKAESRNHKAIFTPIKLNQKVIGYFGCLYTNQIFSDGLNSILRRIIYISLIFSVLVCACVVIFIFVIRGDTWVKKHGIMNHNLERFLAVLIMQVGILLLSGLNMYNYQQDYRNKIENFVRFSLQNLGENINKIREQGVNLTRVQDLRSYIEKRVISLGILSKVRVSERISEINLTDESSGLITFIYETGNNREFLTIEAEISDQAIQKQKWDTLLVLMSTMIILLIFIFELNNLLKFFDVDSSNNNMSFSEEKIALSLRFASFLCATAEYMCLPYAAMMIRESNESLFGLSVGMTAALPISIESFTQLITIMILPRLVKKFNIRVLLIFSAILMAACNISSFIIGGALTIVSCRALAGVAYAGFKQVSNFLITRGYETEGGRSNNISQDIAGLLAGITCGAGMGAILSANAGYGITFLCSSVVFICYLVMTLALIPWQALNAHNKLIDDSTKKSARLKDFARIIFSREVIFFAIIICTPLYIGTMLCMTLIPAICQSEGISAVMLSYCYIANGLTGIYLGPSLVSSAKKKFGSHYPLALVFALTALGLFIVKIPPVALMVIITSMILGFLDGFGTPMVTDNFMSLNIVMNHIDESTALSFYWVLSYLLSTVAPIVAELLLIPSDSFFSPIVIGALLYLAAGILIFISRIFLGYKRITSRRTFKRR